MDGSTDPGGESLKYQAAQHHNTHDHCGSAQQFRAEARDRIDQVLGGHTGGKAHHRTHQSQNAGHQDLTLLLSGSGHEPFRFPQELLRIVFIQFLFHLLPKTHIRILSICCFRLFAFLQNRYETP